MRAGCAESGASAPGKTEVLRAGGRLRRYYAALAAAPRPLSEPSVVWRT